MAAPRRRMASSAAAGALKDYKGREYTHTVDIPVRWGDMDAMGHVNNVQYFVYFEQCRCDFFDSIGLDLSGKMTEGPILADTTCAYKRPVSFPDDLTVGSVAEPKDGSDGTWVHRYAVFSEAAGRVVAEGQATMVNYDYATGKRAAFSDAMRTGLFGADGQVTAAADGDAGGASHSAEAEAVSTDDARAQYEAMLSKFKLKGEASKRPHGMPARKKRD